MKLYKENLVKISGNIAKVDIRQGQNGPYGNVLLMVDDGYYRKNQNNNVDGQWVDRTYPISVKVNANVIKQAGNFGYNKGDFFAVEGKNIVEFGKNQDGSIDNSKKYPKVEAKFVIQHLPANVAKQLREEIKNQKQQFNNQQNGGYQQNSQRRPQQQFNDQQNGGYQQNSQQRPQQQNGGGFNAGNNGHNGNGHNPYQQQNQH